MADKLAILFLIFLMPVSAGEKTIKVGDSFQMLRAKYGMPAKVEFITHSNGVKFEVLSYKSHQTKYVFDSETGSAMDLKPKARFKICNIVNKPIAKELFTC